MATIKFTQLTAPGSTASTKVAGNRNYTFQYKVAAINTNVIVVAQGSLDGTNFFSLASNVTQTVNGTYYLTYSNLLLEEIRFTWVSETGGTAATLDVILSYNT